MLLGVSLLLTARTEPLEINCYDSVHNMTFVTLTLTLASRRLHLCIYDASYFIIYEYVIINKDSFLSAGLGC